MFKLNWQFLIGSILIFSCTKEEKFEFPIVQTGEVTQVNDSSVVFYGKVLSKISGNEMDHGFVWDTDSLPTLETGYHKSLGTVDGALFSSEINSYFIDRQKYFVRAYLVTSEMLVYGRSVAFISKGGGNMQAYDFYPKTGGWGDTISIKHKNIWYKKGETKVFFGESLADVVSSQDSVLKVLVPTSLGQPLSHLKIIVSDAQFSLQGQFSLLTMAINDFAPKLVNFRDVITIHGQNLNPEKEFNSVFLNGEEAEIISCTQETIQVLVTDNIKNSNNPPSVKIVSCGLQCSSNTPLMIRIPVINSFTPGEADRRDNLTITGQYFNPTPDQNKVFIGTVQAKILSATTTEIVTNIPNGVIHGENKLIVEVADSATEAPNPIFIYEPWKRLNDFPGGYKYNGWSFVVNDVAYIGGGQIGWAEWGKDLWEYNQGSDSWIKKKPKLVGVILGFTYENDIYLTEYNQIYRYNATADLRELISTNEALGNTSLTMVFMKGDVAYFICNNYGDADLWEYSFTGNNWSGPKRLSFSTFGTFGFINGDDVFYISTIGNSENKLLKFDYNTKDFKAILDLSNNNYLKYVFEASAFSIDNYSYIIDGHNKYTTSYFNRMIRYDKISNTYVELLAPPFTARTGSVGFAIGRKGYFGLGSDYDTNLTEFWEFDPDKMKPE